MEEQLSGSCTVEITAFNEFTKFITDKTVQEDYDHIIFDTAPTGHTLLLLDSTQSCHREVERTQNGDISDSVKCLLPRLKSSETEVLIVTLPEATPVYEALRLEEDLERAGIAAKWWIVNSSFYKSGTDNKIMKAKAGHEIEWINRVAEHTQGNFAVIPWIGKEVKGNNLLQLT